MCPITSGLRVVWPAGGSSRHSSTAAFCVFVAILYLFLTLCYLFSLSPNQVQSISDYVDDTEGVRKGVVWPVIALSMLLIVIFIVIGLSTYECVACGVADCDTISCCISPCAIFLAVVIWLSAAAAVTLSGETDLSYARDGCALCTVAIVLGACRDLS